MAYGPSFWKFNASLLEYVDNINEKRREWIEKIKIERYIKYAMKQLFVVKRKLKNIRRSVLAMVNLEERLKDCHTRTRVRLATKRLKDCQVKCDEDPTPGNLNAPYSKMAAILVFFCLLAN